jgi:hypothetical protein
MKLSRVGVDLAKNVFQVHGVDRNEKAMWRPFAVLEADVLISAVGSASAIRLFAWVHPRPKLQVDAPRRKAYARPQRPAAQSLRA